MIIVIMITPRLLFLEMPRERHLEDPHRCKGPLGLGEEVPNHSLACPEIGPLENPIPLLKGYRCGCPRSSSRAGHVTQASHEIPIQDIC